VDELVEFISAVLEVSNDGSHRFPRMVDDEGKPLADNYVAVLCHYAEEFMEVFDKLHERAV
jgi:hypothetical protein